MGEGIMAKRKKIDLEKIPLVLEKIASLVDREVDLLGAKASLSLEESKSLVAYATMLTTIYKDYRAEVSAIEKDLKGRTKEDILAIVKAEAS